ncbi:MAG TPA: phosphatase domain-containing protein [Thermoanaerobaculia bacterium]|nr:phosphatase domain-containing protein [Thermoanaerobaculia bacterium]
MAEQSRLHRLALDLETQLDGRLGGRRASDRLRIIAFRGFGRGRELLVRGRVIVDKNISRARSAESVWRSAINAYRRFQSDEVAGARVIARCKEAMIETITDVEGYFQVRLEPSALDDTLWQSLTVELEGGVARTEAFAIVPSAAEFAVISDIDDTVIRTGATSLLTMVRSVLLANAATRLPFDGVAELYRALHRDRNPIFYVSSSPWNLYDLLHDFMDIHGVPHGPMFLQDWGLDESTMLTAPHDTHKLAQIQLLLEYYPDLPFVLIGDSGQRDPEIYLNVIQSHAARIRAVFIRDVSADPRDRAVAAIGEAAHASGVELLYVPDTAAALHHAQRLGLLG